MKVVIFCHSLVSDWNHGNAHFLRGVVAELIDRGHMVDVWEPRDGWSRQNLRRESGGGDETEFAAAFPGLISHEYDLASLDLSRLLDGAGLVLAHEWSDPELIRRLGAHRARSTDYVLLFHDTHHRAVTAPEQIRQFDLSEFDGVLAFGEVIRQLYLDRDWARRAWTWHEAADTRVFSPRPGTRRSDDLIWIGNWGDGERTQELDAFLFTPARRLRLSGTIYGVRYPWRGRLRIRRAGLHYGGWLANHRAPAMFARHQLTVHVPRRPYASALPGIPTIRVFEALACGIPLICAPWEDPEGLFQPGRDYLTVETGGGMREAMRGVLDDRRLAQSLAEHGRATILARHTCGHRVDELLQIHASVASGARTGAL